MGLEELLPRISCPSLLTVGEYDPRGPLDEMCELFDSLQAPAELWVFEDQHHNTNVKANFQASWLGDHHSMAADWIRDRLAGKAVESPGEVAWISRGGPGPYDPAAPRKRRWFDTSR
jgi:hypothetical protein